MWTCSLLKENAKDALYGRYLRSLVVCFLLSFLGVGGLISLRVVEYDSAQYGWQRFTTPRVWTGNGGYQSDLYDLLYELWDIGSYGIDLYYALAYMTVVVLAALAGIALIYFLVKIFLANPLRVGRNRFFMEGRQAPAPMRTVFTVFRRPYLHVVKVMLLKNLKVLLGYCLFIVPGIYWAHCYALVPYLLAENPYLSTRRAMDLSREIMAGEKWHLFVLRLSFIGWVLLCMISFGFGLYFIEPYYQATMAELYAALRSKAFALGLTDGSELGGFVVHEPAYY